MAQVFPWSVACPGLGVLSCSTRGWLPPPCPTPVLASGS